MTSKYRKWSSEEVNKIIEMRRQGYNWPDITKEVGGVRDNVKAAFRRAIGAKHSSYLKVEQPIIRPAPVIAVIDIETMPGMCYFWNMFDEINNIDMIIEDCCMLSWAGRYLNDPELGFDILTPKEAKVRDTKRITQSVWDFLSKADAVVGHNFAGFDVKFINTEFLKHGLPPLKFVIIDTLQLARQHFRFGSNKMKFINDRLGIRNKIDNDGFILWKRCSEGDPKALDTMLEYNKGDISATEELFYKVRPYVRNFNVAVYNESETYQCPACGSTDLTHGQRPWPTPAGLWESARCDKCGCLFRLKINRLTTEKKKHLGVNS